MRRITLGLLIAACLGLCLWAQAPESQKTQEQAPAVHPKAPAPKADDQQPVSEPAPTGPTVTTTEFPLEKFKNFSAIQNGGPVPGLNSDVHVYRSGDMMRAEGSVAVPKYVVTDLVKQKSTSVTAFTCLNMSNAYIRTFPFYVPGPGNTYDITPLGEQTVDGHQCKVVDIRIHRPKKSQEPKFRFYLADDLDGFPLRIESQRKGAWVIKYRDVRLEPQDPSLFIVPHKCESDGDWKRQTPAMAPNAK